MQHEQLIKPTVSSKPPTARNEPEACARNGGGLNATSTRGGLGGNRVLCGGCVRLYFADSQKFRFYFADKVNWKILVSVLLRTLLILTKNSKKNPVFSTGFRKFLPTVL